MAAPRSSITLALGSNLGDREENLRRARARIGEAGVTLRAQSSLWETAPVGPDQPDYLNQVIVGETAEEPRVLLGRFHAIEVALGRDRGAPRNSARPIDIDILALGERRIESAELTVPHAACLDRHFVLVPWAEVDPEAVLPTTGATVAEALAALDARTAATERPRVDRWEGTP